MPQKTSPFLEGKWGWNYGESGWNTGADENWLKFSYMFDANVDAIVSTLPTAVNGEAYFLTTDNRIYFVVDSTYYSTPVPKWFEFKIKSTGVAYRFTGTTVEAVESVENLVSDLGTAAYAEVSDFATSNFQADLTSTAFNKGSALIGRNFQVVGSIAELKALLKTTPSRHAFATGFYEPGDGGGGAYYLDVADTISAEVPGIIVVAADGGRWKLVEGSSIFAETCGAKGDGITDDSQAIKTAIAYVSSRNGGNVRFLPRVYCISETLLVNTSSVGLVGSGAESYIMGDFGTLLRWIGTVTASMVEFDQVDCPVFSGIKLDCANQASGLRASGVKYGKFTNFAIRDFVTVGFYGLCGAVPGQWSSGNHVQQFLITSSNPGVSGLLLDGDAAANNDWFNNTFINGTIQVSRTTPQSFAAHLAFCDSNTFIEVDFTDGAGSGTAEGVLFNSGTRTAFPTNNNFVSCSMTSAVANEPVGTEIGTNYMQLYPTKDGEALPAHPKLIGTTDDGQFFGPNLWLKHDFGRIRLAPHSADRSYDILLNGSDSVDAGIQIIRRAAGADTVYLQIDQTGAIYIFIPGVGLRQILAGGAGSGGLGYRMLMVAN